MWQLVQPRPVSPNLIGFSLMICLINWTYCVEKSLSILQNIKEHPVTCATNFLTRSFEFGTTCYVHRHRSLVSMEARCIFVVINLVIGLRGFRSKTLHDLGFFNYRDTDWSREKRHDSWVLLEEEIIIYQCNTAHWIF